MSQQKVIVSRHPAAIEFIRRELPDFSGISGQSVVFG